MSDTALRLANLVDHGSDSTQIEREVAAELRRLHAENEALREANESFGKRQEWWNEKMVALEERNDELVIALQRIAGRCDAQPMYKIALEALAKVEKV